MSSAPEPRAPASAASAAGAAVHARIFRRSGTRILCAAGLGAAQLIAVRAAASGVPVLVRSERRDLWRAPLQAFGQRIFVDSRPAPEMPSRLDQPVLYVDDQPAEAAANAIGEARPWQCRVLVRAVGSAADLQALASADLMLLGRLPADVAAEVSSMFGLGAVAGPQLSGLPRGKVALIRARTLRMLSLAPTADERRALGM